MPLRDDGCAVGLVARAAGGGVLFGYFFGPRHGPMGAGFAELVLTWLLQADG